MFENHEKCKVVMIISLPREATVRSVNEQQLCGTVASLASPLKEGGGGCLTTHACVCVHVCACVCECV